MALKSSPLNPSRGKLISQHLVVDHMSAHYKKLLNAKPAIDASVPKAYLRSQQVRDHVTRNQVLKGKIEHPSSARNTSRQIRKNFGINGTARYSARNHKTQRRKVKSKDWMLDEDDYDGFTQEERDQINSLVNETINTDRVDNFLKEDNSLKQEKFSPRSGNGSGGMRTSRGQIVALNTDTSRRKKMSADILDKRNHVFTEGDDFTPRTLRNPKYQNVPSKLSQTKHFRPAKPMSAPSTNKNQTAKSYALSNAESELLDETLMSRDFTTRLTMSGTVPKLDISIDQDHVKWLQEQSARNESSSFTPLELELRSQALQTSNMNKSFTRSKIQKEDEELLYLDFITGVTNDVLTRGIFTNRVLHNVFEEHIQKNKDKLSEVRMRGMLDNLRSDLGISPPDDPYEPTSSEDVGMGVKRPEVRSRSKTTGYTGNINQFKNVRLGQQQQRADEKPLEYDKSNRKDEMVLTATIEPAETVEADPSLLLTDIAEVSEKSATSLGSKRSKKYTLKVKPESEEQMHELTSLLGLDDVAVNKDKPLMTDTHSVHSALSTHTSDQTPSKKSLTRQYADQVSDRDKADGLSDQASHHSTPSRQRSQYSDDRQMSRPSSLTTKHVAVSERQRSRPSSSKSSKRGTTADTPEHKQAEDLEEVESNADFGKTTLFAKTKDLKMTYKALSQSSGGDEDEDNYDYEDDF